MSKKKIKNKDKILLAATRLFNEMGFVNVRLQHISDDTIISLGNIAYHFKNKEAIVRTIFEDWQTKQREILIEYRHTPILANIDRIFSSVESVQQTYSFFFTDLLEIQRAYPTLFEEIERFFQWQIFLFQDIIRFNISRGAMHRLDEEGISFLARLVVQQLNSWPYVQRVWPETLAPSRLLAVHIWRLLFPYLNELGRQELAVLQTQRIGLSGE